MSLVIAARVASLREEMGGAVFLIRYVYIFEFLKISKRKNRVGKMGCVPIFKFWYDVIILNHFSVAV